VESWWAIRRAHGGLVNRVGDPLIILVMRKATVDWRVDLLVNRAADPLIIFVMLNVTVDQEVDPPLTVLLIGGLGSFYVTVG